MVELMLMPRPKKQVGMMRTLRVEYRHTCKLLALGAKLALLRKGHLQLTTGH
jgi:hypothetical protein